MARAETHSNDENFKNELNDYRNLWGDIFAAYDDNSINLNFKSNPKVLIL